MENLNVRIRLYPLKDGQLVEARQEGDHVIYNTLTGNHRSKDFYVYRCTLSEFMWMMTSGLKPKGKLI